MQPSSKSVHATLYPMQHHLWQPSHTGGSTPFANPRKTYLSKSPASFATWNIISTVLSVSPTEVTMECIGCRQCTLGDFHLSTSVILSGSKTLSVVHQQQTTALSIQSSSASWLNPMPILSTWARRGVAFPGMHPHCLHCSVSNTSLTADTIDTTTPPPPVNSYYNMVRSCCNTNRHPLPRHCQQTTTTISPAHCATNSSGMGPTIPWKIIPYMGNCNRWDPSNNSSNWRTGANPNGQDDLAISPGYVGSPKPAPTPEHSPT